MKLSLLLIRIEYASNHDSDVVMLCDQLRAGNMQGRRQLASMALRLSRGRLTMQERHELSKWGRLDGLAKVAEIRGLG